MASGLPLDTGSRVRANVAVERHQGDRVVRVAQPNGPDRFHSEGRRSLRSPEMGDLHACRINRGDSFRAPFLTSPNEHQGTQNETREGASFFFTTLESWRLGAVR